jgi:hypothetical protein
VTTRIPPIKENVSSRENFDEHVWGMGSQANRVEITDWFNSPLGSLATGKHLPLESSLRDNERVRQKIF